MSMKIRELSGKRDLETAMKLVFDNFTLSEKDFYKRPEFLYAKKSLLSYDVFNIDELQEYIHNSVVKVFAVYAENDMIAISSLRLDDGKILFMSFSSSKIGKIAGQMLVEHMAEQMENLPEKNLTLLSFVGQEKDLVSLGFIRINPSVFKFFGVKFIAMRYDFSQIDIER